MRIELSLVIQALNKNTWHSHVTSVVEDGEMASEEEIPMPLKSRENAMYYFIGCLIDQAQLNSHGGGTQ